MANGMPSNMVNNMNFQVVSTTTSMVGTEDHSAIEANDDLSITNRMQMQVSVDDENNEKSLPIQDTLNTDV